MNAEGKSKPKNLRSIPKSVVSNDDKLGKALSSSRQRPSQSEQSQNQSRGSENSSRLLRTALGSARDTAAKPRSVELSQDGGNRKRESDQQHSRSNDLSTKKLRGESGPEKAPQSTITVPDQFLESMKNYAAMSGFRSLDDMMKAYQSGAIPPMMMPPFMMGFPPMGPGGPMPFPPFPPMGPEFHGLPPVLPPPMGFPGPPGGWGMPPGAEMMMQPWQYPPHDGYRGGHHSFRGGRGNFPGRGRGFAGRGPPPEHRNPNPAAEKKVADAEATPANASEADTAAASAHEEMTADASGSSSAEGMMNTNDRFSGRGGRGFLPRGRGRGAPARGFSGRSFRGRMPFPGATASGPSGNKNKVWVREADLENPLVANR
jgi:hypothetical protein